MTFILKFLYFFCQALTMAVVARVVLSWFSSQPSNFLARFIFAITEPLLWPVRKVIPRVWVFDLAPMIVVLLLQAIIVFVL
ncbi:MAG: YggT family protein [Chloroflexi bacterium]|nr:YggT family protein [Chloroflexota bacterium]